jgi:hypothetical protein
MLPIISYCSATLIMYNLSISQENKIYNKYTGWSRLQIIFCIPFLFYENNMSYIASDLIYFNSFGCLFAVHVFYFLSKYRVLDILASRSLKKYAIYQKLCYFIKYKIIIHLIADLILHGTPAIVSYLYLKPTPIYPYKKYLWLLPAISHVLYPYLLIKTWNPIKLYEINIIFPNWIYMLGWIGTFSGYYLISYFL